MVHSVDTISRNIVDFRESWERSKAEQKVEQEHKEFRTG